jgi:hypothetical protein
MEAFWWGVSSSAVVGLVLWWALPRGALLTKERIWRDDTALSRWQIRNVSSVKISITRVDYRSTRTSPPWTEPSETQARARRVRWWIRSKRVLPARASRGHRRGLNAPWRPIPNPDDEMGLVGVLGVDLRFDEPKVQVYREKGKQPWRGEVLAPGDTLTAFIDDSSHGAIRIRYQRAGPLGWVERRSLTVDTDW